MGVSEDFRCILRVFKGFQRFTKQFKVVPWVLSSFQRVSRASWGCMVLHGILVDFRSVIECFRCFLERSLDVIWFRGFQKLSSGFQRLTDAFQRILGEGFRECYTRFREIKRDSSWFSGFSGTFQECSIRLQGDSGVFINFQMHFDSGVFIWNPLKYHDNLLELSLKVPWMPP